MVHAMEQALRSFEDVDHNDLLKGEEAGVSFISPTTPFLHVDPVVSNWDCCTTRHHSGFLHLALPATAVFSVFPDGS